MKTIKFDEDRDAWFSYRRGKITGSKAGDITPKKNGDKKIGYYELIAERVAEAPDEQDPRERGNSLEKEAIMHFMVETGKEVDTSLLVWEREDDPSIAISPDGVISEKEGVEVKCLSSARHIECYLTQEIPSEYKFQALQYFIVNEKLQTLYFVFYDPRVLPKKFFTIEITRDQELVDTYLAEEKRTLFEINEDIKKLQK